MRHVSERNLSSVVLLSVNLSVSVIFIYMTNCVDIWRWIIKVKQNNKKSARAKLTLLELVLESTNELSILAVYIVSDT